ncbi:4Fe-4S binding protein [Chromobacterium violaceum]|uniref:4Fe-4S binding protein n=1 Tax=Chromobacterium violaceum TaxID=536 RepID=UPI00111BD14D|nr:4Fe-4S binding protein [Chromobacterium violaceum]QRO32409.1 4Fe-4S binding protein [Chromobacterium violaceum]QRQ17791.1 4Fe-4S binding protein [Chromobacterium violaceum]
MKSGRAQRPPQRVIPIAAASGGGSCSPERQPRGLLALAGIWLRDHASLLRKLQWVVVLVYAFLLIVPAGLSLPEDTARMWNNLTIFAQFVFWGIWWPFVLLSMVLFGRLWCGVLCPEGALSEWAARKGMGRPIPRWMRWGGWPFVAFVLTTVYGQLVSVYQYPKAALLVLGGSTVAAVAIGFVYTRGKRAWCRHLCPVNGVFGLLSKLAPLYYRVDEAAWKRSQSAHERTPAVDCAPLQPLRHMQGGSGCHMCGRCSDHRGAIELSLRSSSDEVVRVAEKEADGWQTALIIYGLLGVAMGAFHWTMSPWFVALKQAAAEWLVDRDIMWPLDTEAPWWLLTHYPQHNDVFSWLDGASLIAYVAATALVLGTGILASLALSVAVSGGWRTQRLHHLAQALIPLAGCGVFLGLSALTVTLLKAEGFGMHWVNDARLALLAGANLWALHLARGILARWNGGLRRWIALLPFCGALALVDCAWGFMFWWW